MLQTLTLTLVLTATPTPTIIYFWEELGVPRDSSFKTDRSPDPKAQATVYPSNYLAWRFDNLESEQIWWDFKCDHKWTTRKKFAFPPNPYRPDMPFRFLWIQMCQKCGQAREIVMQKDGAWMTLESRSTERPSDGLLGQRGK